MFALYAGKQTDVTQISETEVKIMQKTEFYGRRQGRAEDNNSGRLNPKAQQFNHHIGVAPVNSDRNDSSQSKEAQTLNN